ncbi:MAG: hypothetical protein ACRC28_00895 [Clostridium sp.]|uniref:hypothetical protein n=1 Tax=Clostridia TaxID=186801 RepID=UPI003F3707CA
MSGLEKKWIEEFANRNEEKPKGKKINMDVVDEAFDIIANELKEAYEKKGINSRVVERRRRYLKLDDYHEIEVKKRGEFEVNIELYKSSKEDKLIKCCHSICIKSKVDKCDVYIGEVRR